MRIVVGVTGASGVVLGQKVCEALSRRKDEIHLVVSKAAQATVDLEIGPQADFPSSHRWDDDDFRAPLASSSFIATVDAVIVAPTSMKSAAALAHGLCDTVILRAADAALRLHRRLVLVPRETPLGEVALENLLRLARTGAIIVPPAVGWYARPKTIEDVNAFLAGKILDAAGVPNDLYTRWGT